MRVAIRSNKYLKIVTREDPLPAYTDAAALSIYKDCKDKARALIVMALGIKPVQVIQALEEDPPAIWAALQT